MPTHRGERWIGDTLESLSTQSERGFECVVIDSSPDSGTRDLIARYAEAPHGLDLKFHIRPDLEHWRSKTNFGFQVARAPFVSMLHQDDFWLPDRAAHLRRWLQERPDAVMHLHPSHIVDANSKRLGTWRAPLPTGPVPSDLLIERLLVQNFISVPAQAIRRDAYLAVGGLDESLWYTGDWDLYLKLARAGQFVYHPDVLSCFRIHGQSLTVSGSKSADDFAQQLRGVLAAHEDAVRPERRQAVLRRARASNQVNVALAAANQGDWQDAARAVGAVLQLGPRDAAAYLRDSRIVERVWPRLKARLAKTL